MDDHRRIAVEVKSFIRASPTQDFAEAIGQYSVYRTWFAELEPEREIWLAVDTTVVATLFAQRAAAVVLRANHVHVVAIDVLDERIVQWIPTF